MLKACENGDYKTVKKLINEKDLYIYTYKEYIDVNPLLVSIYNNHYKIANLLIKNGADINAYFDYDMYILKYCIEYQKYKFIKLLINNNVKIRDNDIVNVAINCNLSTLKLILNKYEYNDNIFNSICSKKNKINNDNNITFLLQKLKNIEIKDINGNTPLNNCSIFGNYKISLLLINKKAVIDTINNDGNTPLTNSSQYANNNILILLIKNGANINHQNNNGNTALHLACNRNFIDIIKLLLKNNININMLNVKHNTALDLICMKNNCDTTNTVKLLLNNGASGKYALYNACKFNNIHLIQLLLDHKININTNDEALHISCENGNIDIITILLKNGININTKNKDGETPLHVSCRKNNKNIIIFLIKKGADVNCIDNNGNTLLHSACCTNKLNSIEYLLKIGFDINAVNNDGNTPLHISAIGGFDKLTKFLLQNGADKKIKNKNGKNAKQCAINEQYYNIGNMCS
jgi:ankyrin repeat protein